MWDVFSQRHKSRDSAFEALCCQLFERWCRREYKNSIRSFYFVDGRGGDGGVEAFVILNDDSVVGLQVKAWWDGFHNPQKSQVEESLRSATSRHERLIRYVVCCPLDLLPAQGQGNAGTSQLERWKAFISKAESIYNNVTIEYRGEAKIREWLQQPESEAIGAYWFDKAVVPRDHWRMQFERTKSGWMDLRYVPDLHVSTMLDEDLSWFVNTPEVVGNLKSEISRLADILGEKRERIYNLQNLPGDHSTQALADCIVLVDGIDSALSNLRLLRAAAESQSLPAIEGDFSTDLQTWEAASRLLDELEGKNRLAFATSPTHSVFEAVKGLRDNLEAVHGLLHTQLRLRRIRLVFGEAGTGKTQTITKLCDIASGEGAPVLLLPARAYSPNNSWNDILGQASNRPGWTADQILDALEASSLFAWRESPLPRSAPRRAILALDGPDENSTPGTWDERLRELADLCKKRPLIAPIVTTRPESRAWLSPDEERFETIHVRAPDIADQLPEIFQGYIRKYNITVPSPDVLAWTLRTPFAIRTFAEVYRGRTIAPGQNFVTALAELFRLKLRRLDEELNRRNPSWAKDRELSLHILRSLVPSFIDEANCSYQQFVESVRDSLSPLGLTIDNAAALFERSAREHGLIEIYTIPKGQMEPNLIIVRPGFNALLDYLLAIKVADKVRQSLNGGQADLTQQKAYLPTLQGRSNVGSLVVAMLLKDGISILDSGVWENLVPQHELEEWHARAICDLLPDQASTHMTWVSNLLRRDMTTCRMLIARLILPSSRIPGATFGAEFLHQEFKLMSLTERDLVWSGPDWLPSNCGGPWEGEGIPVHDLITLRNDDSASSVPVLVAWVTSSVIRERQNRAIAQLAKWGSKRPAELADLLLNFAIVDDVQVIESVAVATAGAVLELAKPGAADELAKVAHEIFFGHREEKDHPSVVARHAARLVIARAFTIGTNLPDFVRADSTPPYSAVGPWLSLDAKVVSISKGEGEGGGEFRLYSDLDWYVADLAIEPFFKQRSPGTPNQATRRYQEVPEQILKMAADGYLGVDTAVRVELNEEIDVRAENRPFFNLNLAPLVTNADTAERVDDEFPNFNENKGEPLTQESLKEIYKAFRTRSDSLPPSRFGPEAESMLVKYGRDVSASEPLNPKQIGNGLIEALVTKWGWNRETFYGDPQGEKPGEILGADIAIMRRHSPATHGSRSPVARFAEKYVWSAVNVVSSFLCDRLPGEVEWGIRLAMIQDQSGLGSRMPDPLVGYRPDTAPVFRAPWNPVGIAPQSDLTETRQPGRGIQWLKQADWPNPADWFEAGEDEQILLSGFLSSKDHQTGIQIAAWVSCIAIPRAQLHLIQRDVKSAPELWTSTFSVHELEGFFGGGIYAPLRLAAWSPWAADEKTETWHTLSDSGEPIAIPLAPLVTKTHWEGTEGETTARCPSKFLRDAGNIIDCCGTDDSLQFVDRDRVEVAYFQRMNFPDSWSKSNQHLQIQRSVLFRSLAKQDLVPVWGIRLYRELLPELLPNGWIDQDCYWLVVTDDDGAKFRSTLVKSKSHDDNEERVGCAPPPPKK